MDFSMYACMMALGGANLVPWMTFISLPDYFAEFYGTNAMEFFFPAVSTAALVATAATLLVVGSQLSFNARIAVPTALLTALSLAVPAIDILVRTNLLSLNVAFGITLVAVCLSAIFSSTAQNSLYALAGLLGDQGTAALQAGQGVMGILSLVLRVITKVGVQGPAAMYAFCSLGALMLFGSLLGYYALIGDPQIRPRVDAHELRRAARTNNPHAAEPMLASEGGGHSRGSGGRSSGPSALALLRLTCSESACVFSTFFVALSIFPGLTTSLQSTTGLGSWYPILLVGSYNFGDLIGKSAPSRIRWVTSTTLPLCALAHTCFVPALLLLSHPAYLPVMLRTDAFACAVVFKLGVSTGYIGCMSLVLGTERAETPEDKEGAGLFTSFALMMGLAAGSSTGLFLASTLAE